MLQILSWVPSFYIPAPLPMAGMPAKISPPKAAF
jgi:hypothetical protein